MLVWYYLCVYRDTPYWKKAEIKYGIGINRMLSNGKDICWWFSEDIPAILHETDTNHQLLLYSWQYYFQWSNGRNADFTLFKLNKHTMLDMADTACLHVVHILQHPTSRRTSNSAEHTIDAALNINLLPLQVYNYIRWTMWCTRWRHHTTQWKCALRN